MRPQTRRGGGRCGSHGQTAAARPRGSLRSPAAPAPGPSPSSVRKINKSKRSPGRRSGSLPSLRARPPSVLKEMLPDTPYQTRSASARSGRRGSENKGTRGVSSPSSSPSSSFFSPSSSSFSYSAVTFQVSGRRRRCCCCEDPPRPLGPPRRALLPPLSPGGSRGLTAVRGARGPEAGGRRGAGWR